MPKKLIFGLSFVVSIACLAVGCTASETVIEPTDFAFDGTCVNCHAGLSAGHVHTNYKLRCIDCHGGDDRVVTPDNVLVNKSLTPGGGGFRDPTLLALAHVLPDKNIARFFFANGVDDDGNGNCFQDHRVFCVKDADCPVINGKPTPCQLVDEPPGYDQFPNPTQLIDPGEIFEPQLHGEGPGEFVDAELNRDLNYTRFLNPGDLRVASIGCGSGSRGAFDGGGNGSCHQQTIDIVRRGLMVGNTAVTNGAYYGNQSARADFVINRDDQGPASDPRFGAFSYSLDYAANNSVDSCIRQPRNPGDPRSQPFFDSACLQARAASLDPAIRAGAPGNAGVGAEVPKAFEIAQGTITPVPGTPPGRTIEQVGAGDTRFPWGGTPALGDAHAELEPLLNDFLIPPGALGTAPGGVPDPVDNILRTFRAYYPLNYPASTNNFNFTFGTSILPEIARYRTATAYGRGHSSGCAACHTPYAYDGARQPTKIRNLNPQDTNGNGKLDDNELFTFVVDPTTKHREFDATKDIGRLDDGISGNADRLIGRPVRADEVKFAGGVAQGAVDLDNDGKLDGEQQRTYSQDHTTTTRIDTDTCGLCHGFVTRINYAYQGMAEEEQRDALSRRAPVEFQTPNGTNVRIVDSWVREDFDPNGDGVRDVVPTLIRPEGVGVADRARQRDAQLAAQGFLPGFGGCVPAVFSEDCNNNGELDTNLVLNKLDIDGNVVASVTINEDANGNGKLDLIDRLPREKAIDGRQVRYIYGGRNGSTRQMDVHFQVGMHCIDCHFLQDVHGDGNVYSTNWDAIEIECEDCHGAGKRTNFLTSGPNGGNDLRRARNEDREPFFEERGGRVIQRSRVTPGLSWIVPQTVDVNATNVYAKEAHAAQHVAEPGQGSTFVSQQGSSEITEAKVECASCHNGWITNCMGCHVDINVGDKQRDTVASDGSIAKSAGENEIWMSNTHNPGHINFQLLGLLRAPFVLGVAGRSELGRLANVRSSMQAHVSATDETGDTIRDNLTFTTFQALDANSGRSNVATSGVTMNQTMAHTVRPKEARGCEVCHSLVDDRGRIRNEHLMAQTFGTGTGSLPYVGDWIFTAGAGGLELYEYKQERELANNNNAGASQRFPGMIVNDTNPTPANVEPLLGGAIGNDVVFIRNFNATPSVPGGTQAPTLRDLAVLAVNPGGAQGEIVITDVSVRGHRTLAGRPNQANQNLVTTVTTLQPAVALTHLASDVSDPYVYAAIGSDGIAVIRINNAPSNIGVPATVLHGSTAQNRIALPGGQSATDVALAGDLLYVGTAQGVLHVFDINDPENPKLLSSLAVSAGPINDMVVNGFILYAATANGLTALQLDDPEHPAPPSGLAALQFVGPTPALGVAVNEGHAFVANGVAGVHEIDMRAPAAPVDLGRINPLGVDAVDVIVSLLPGQKWVMGLRGNGDVVGTKLDNRVPRAERCYPDPGTADCLLELEMYDPTRSGRDPSFNPLTGLFDNPAVDPSAKQVITLPSNILGSGKRMARPVMWEAIGTLTGRRYRDSFMPGAGVMSLSVMQRMRAVQVCIRPGGASTNPSGLDELGYLVEGVCQSFRDFSSTSAKPKPKRNCKSAPLGSRMHQLLCDPPTTSVKTANLSPGNVPTTGPTQPRATAAAVGGLPTAR